MNLTPARPGPPSPAAPTAGLGPWAWLLWGLTALVLLALWAARLAPWAVKPLHVHHMHEGIIDDYSPRQKVVFIARDPRDAIVSGYFYIKNGLDEGDMNATRESLARLDPEAGLEQQLIKYMKYRMPVMAYWFHLQHPNVTRVRYEDLLGDLAGQVRRINRDAGIHAPERHVERVIAQVSFESMSGGRRPGAENRASHFRKGVSGDWKNHFTERHCRIFREMGGEDLLRDMGYDV